MTYRDCNLRVQVPHRLRHAIAIDHLGVLPAEQSRLPYSAGMGNHLHLMHEIGGVVGNPLGLVGGIKSLLQILIMGRDACGAGVPITLQ